MGAWWAEGGTKSLDDTRAEELRIDGGMVMASSRDYRTRVAFLSGYGDRLREMAAAFEDPEAALEKLTAYANKSAKRILGNR